MSEQSFFQVKYSPGASSYSYGRTEYERSLCVTYLNDNFVCSEEDDAFKHAVHSDLEQKVHSHVKIVTKTYFCMMVAFHKSCGFCSVYWYMYFTVDMVRAILQSWRVCRSLSRHLCRGQHRDNDDGIENLIPQVIAMHRY